MDPENVKVRERVELSLDGRQIASIVVGALVLLGVVFVVGFNLGRNLGVRQLEATRGDALAALDRPPPSGAPLADDALTFHDRLTKEKAPADDLSARTPVAAPASSPGAAAPAPPAAAAPSPATPAQPAASARPAAAKPPAAGAFTVQLMSTPNRAEADKLAARLQEFDPRVEATEVKEKGRYYRVRAGSFETRADAERLLKTISARTGGKGMVVSTTAK